MSRTIQQHNGTRGHALAIKVMDLVRIKNSAGEEVSMWRLMSELAVTFDIQGEKPRRQLYQRIENAVRQLEAGGLITSEKKYTVEQRYIKYIKPC